MQNGYKEVTATLLSLSLLAIGLQKSQKSGQYIDLNPVSKSGTMATMLVKDSFWIDWR